MSNYDKVRERIAKGIRYAETLGEAISWEMLDDGAKAYWLHFADVILADPDILIKAENQDLPNCDDGYNDFNSKHPKYKEAVNDMLKNGWVKTEPKL